MSLGFKFRETMSGSYHLASAPDHERAMSFTIAARAYDIGRYLRDRTVQIEGEVDLEGFADHRPMRGTMLLDPLLGKRVRYVFDFEANDGRKCTFDGEKNVELLRFMETITTLPGEIRDAAGRTIGSAKLRFDARSDLPKFLRSWKVA